jgi:hypothetical protein
MLKWLEKTREICLHMGPAYAGMGPSISEWGTRGLSQTYTFGVVKNKSVLERANIDSPR